MTEEHRPVSLDPSEIKQILDALAASEWDEAVVTVGETTVSVARNGARLGAAAPLPGAPPAAAAPAGAPAPAPPAPPVASPAPPAPTSTPAPAPSPTAEAAADGLAVTSPSVGVFWRSPQPGAPPFVEVGAHVEAGDTVAIVEVMKLMNNIAAPAAGTVAALSVENAAQVEHGDTLMIITPDAG